MLRSRRLHRGLVLSEIALSIVPLIAAGLMLRTFANLLEAPIGFDPAHVVTARVSLNLDEFRTVDRRSAFYRDASRARAGTARCRGGQRRRATPLGAGSEHPALLAKRGWRGNVFARHASERHARLPECHGDSAARGPRHFRRRYPPPSARHRRRRAAGGAVVARRCHRQTAGGCSIPSSRWRLSAWPATSVRATSAMPAP